MNRALVVIDMQNDFITGSLGTKEAQEIVPGVIKKISEYRDRGDQIVFTKDTHLPNYLSSHEGKYLPVEHCIYLTEGWEIPKEIDSVPDAPHRLKITFGNFEWWDYDDEKFPDEIEIVGLCTDICVISNALILRSQYPDVDITVDASCCAGTTPEMHRAALNVMKSCQINVVNE